MDKTLLTDCLFMKHNVLGDQVQVLRIAISEVQIASVVTIKKRSLGFLGSGLRTGKGGDDSGRGLRVVTIDEGAHVLVGVFVIEDERPTFHTTILHNNYFDGQSTLIPSLSIYLKITIN